MTAAELMPGGWHSSFHSSFSHASSRGSFFEEENKRTNENLLAKASDDVASPSSNNEVRICPSGSVLLLDTAAANIGRIPGIRGAVVGAHCGIDAHLAPRLVVEHLRADIVTKPI